MSYRSAGIPPLCEEKTVKKMTPSFLLLCPMLGLVVYRIEGQEYPSSLMTRGLTFLGPFQVISNRGELLLHLCWNIYAPYSFLSR